MLLFWLSKVSDTACSCHITSSASLEGLALELHTVAGISSMYLARNEGQVSFKQDEDPSPSNSGVHSKQSRGTSHLEADCFNHLLLYNESPSAG